MKYTVIGVEEVYDAFDDYEHASLLTPAVVEAFSVDSAINLGYELLRKEIEVKREAFWSSGDFSARVMQVIDSEGYLVFQNTSDLVRIWPFASDERSLAKPVFPDTDLPRVCFISYNQRDAKVARLLYNKLLQHRFMCWFAPERTEMPQISWEDNQILEKRLAEAIGSARVVLVVVSENSIKSDWVRFEVNTALESFRTAHRPNIVGLQLDKMAAQTPWFQSLSLAHPIHDFSNWENEKWFSEQVDMLAKELMSFFLNNSKGA